MSQLRHKGSGCGSYTEHVFELTVERVNIKKKEPGSDPLKTIT